jgi:hypothetical protein
LNDLIHQFDQGASREIWKRYATNRLEPAIGSAVAAGILRREELPEDLLRRRRVDRILRNRRPGLVAHRAARRPTAS